MPRGFNRSFLSFSSGIDFTLAVCLSVHTGCFYVFVIMTKCAHNYNGIQHKDYFEHF